METKRLKYSGIALGIIMVTAFVLVQPTMQTSYAQVVDEGAPAFESCEFVLRQQARDPLSMNTVKNGEIAKTIISEKEIFECELVQGGEEVLVHVNTVVEVLENMTTKEVISHQALVISCVKEDADRDGVSDSGTVFGCDWYRPGTDFIPVTNCDDRTNDYLEHPNEMNTVNKGKTVKTIIAQKEVIECEFNDVDPRNNKKVEQYIIEEIWEDLRLAPDDTVVQLNT
ncbi:MAG: hypothetical protein ACRD38_07535, partial [Nitrososphaerales archaeon]